MMNFLKISFYTAIFLGYIALGVLYWILPDGTHDKNIVFALIVFPAIIAVYYDQKEKNHKK